MNDELRQVAKIVRSRNALAEEMARIIRRPMQIGHVGEFIASRLFDIELEASASNAGFDGRFRSGALAGKTVNIKWYAKREGLLDLPPDGKDGADFYLVLAGPKGGAGREIDEARPWLIHTVHLFERRSLIQNLSTRGKRIGIATSVAQEFWRAAEIWPKHCENLLKITDEQDRGLRLFGAGTQKIQT